MNLSRPQKLKLVFAATVVVAAGIEGTVLAQHHRAPAGRDAFLNYQVDSTDELVATLKNNKNPASAVCPPFWDSRRPRY